MPVHQSVDRRYACPSPAIALLLKRPFFLRTNEVPIKIPMKGVDHGHSLAHNEQVCVAQVRDLSANGFQSQRKLWAGVVGGGQLFFFLFSLELFLFGIFGCEYVKMTCTSMIKPWVVDVCVQGSRTETAIPCPLLN